MLINRKNVIPAVVVSLLCLPMSTFSGSKAPLPVNPDRSGEHVGERNQLDMTFAFSGNTEKPSPTKTAHSTACSGMSFTKRKFTSRNTGESSLSISSGRMSA